ncbi:hypothetical protein ACJMK2_033442 [Sinanodonta woodiana]|uniref:Multiple inositol polyphosphate phosphatase 1 n=1 Tax=Sinanodonta woodiana TaxID=1069815 RepID=A0ABD3WND0_SINWO
MVASGVCFWRSCILILPIIFIYVDCFRKDLFSTKTCYHWIYDLDQHVPQDEYMKTEISGQSCQAIYASALIRHGARYPSLKDIRSMSELHKKLLRYKVDKKLKFLTSWKNPYPEAEEKGLVKLGEVEQYQLGLRINRKLFSLFENNLENVKFVSSSTSRTKKSLQAFHKGFNGNMDEDSNVQYDIDDKILRFHTKCKRFLESVENNKTHIKEYRKFKSESHAVNLAAAVAKRLEVDDLNITTGDLKLLYFLCPFEIIISNKEDWCHILTDEEKEIMEYHYDLKQYWKKAYGHSVIPKMACPMVKKLFSHFDNAIKNRKQEERDPSVGSFFFGHVETLAPVYAALGLFNDTVPLLANNFEQQRNRLFKASHILPFSANIVLILYDCHSNGEAGGDNRFALKLYVNEKVTKFPGCQDDTCWYDEVRQRVSSHVDGCEFDRYCGMGEHAHTAHGEL